MKSKLFVIAAASMALISCAAIRQQQTLQQTKEFQGERGIASDHWRRRPIPGVDDGVYVAKRIVDNTGQIGVLREFGLMREYDGDFLKAILIEVNPMGPGRPGRPGTGPGPRGARVDIQINRQIVTSHEVDSRRGLPVHLHTLVNRAIGDEIREMKVLYDPRDVMIREITLLVNVNDGPLPPPPGPFPPNPYPPGPVPPPPPSGPLNKVTSYSDDHCTRAITEVTDRDSCYQLESIYGSNQLWSVNVNGRCINIPDRNFRGSCEGLQAIARQPRPVNPSVQMYTDDHCTNALLDIDAQTNCQGWGMVLNGMQVWSARAEGRCRNIADRAYSAQLCEQFQTAGREIQYRQQQPDAVELFADDSCTNAVTYVQRGDNCGALNMLFGDSQVWSIRFRGRCENIPDTNFPSACQNYSR